MRTQFLRRLMPQKRRWWVLAALLLAVVGLAIAGLCSPGLQQLVASTLNGAEQACAQDDGHDHAKEAADAHGEPEAPCAPAVKRMAMTMPANPPARRRPTTSTLRPKRSN